MELDSPHPTRFPRQFPNNNGPPDFATRSSPGLGAESTSVVVTSTAIATYSATNTLSLVMDPSASAGAGPKSIAPTSSTTETIEETATGTSTAQLLFTSQGRLFAVGMVIIGLAVLTLLTCIVVLTRCTLRRRRRERTLSLARQHAQSQSQSPNKSEKKRKISSDRASEFWSADVNRRTRSGDSELGRSLDGAGALTRKPTRPERTGETESDLRAPGPGRVHFTPSVTMSDYTALSMDVQGGSARGSAATFGARPGSSGQQGAGIQVATDPLTANALGVNQPPVSKHLSSATKWTLDPDPFASTPIATPASARPFLPHSTTFPPYSPNSPHTPNNNPYADGHFTSHLSSSPPDMVASTSNLALSEMTSLEPAVSSSNLNHFPSQHPQGYLPDQRVPIHRASTGLESLMSSSAVDPFPYDRSHASIASNPYASIGVPSPLHISPTSPGIQTSPLSYPPIPSPAGEMAFPPATYSSPASLGASPPHLGMVEQRQSYLFGSPPQQSPPQQSYLSYSPPQQSYISSSPPQQSYLSTPPQASFLSITPPQPPAHLQADVSHALSNLRRRMSDSTVASTHTGNTSEYRPTLGAVAESPHRPGFFMHTPESPRRSLPLLSTTPGDGAPTYASPTSMVDTYYQDGERSKPGSRLGSGDTQASPALPDSVRTSVLSYFDQSRP